MTGVMIILFQKKKKKTMNSMFFGAFYSFLNLMPFVQNHYSQKNKSEFSWLPEMQVVYFAIKNEEKLGRRKTAQKVSNTFVSDRRRHGEKNRTGTKLASVCQVWCYFLQQQQQKQTHKEECVHKRGCSHTAGLCDYVGAPARNNFTTTVIFCTTACFFHHIHNSSSTFNPWNFTTTLLQ